MRWRLYTALATKRHNAAIHSLALALALVRRAATFLVPRWAPSHDDRLMRIDLRTCSMVSVVALAATLAPEVAWGVTLTVGPGRMYATPSAAAAAARDGDLVEIAAGTYRDIAVWRAQNLTIRGVGGMAHLDATGLTIPNGKAIWVIAGRGYTLEHLEFSGARVPDRNGAGIRQEAAGLTVRDCFFHDNENGILAGADTTSDIVVEASEFARNGAGDGQSHNLYIGNVRSFTLRGCYSHDAVVGHLVKSRAQANYLIANRITGEGGTDSYEVDLPNGGLAVLVGNILEQGSATQNPVIVTFAEEGATNPTQRFYLVNNTLVNNRAGGTYVRLVGSASAVVTNNLFLGAGTQVSGTATSSHNLDAARGWFVDAARFDFRLTPGAGAIDMGVDPGAMPAGSVESLVATSQYLHPHTRSARSVSGAALDVGAYEFVATTTPDAGVADGATDPPPRDAGDASTEFVPDVTARDVMAIDAPDDVAVDVAVDAVITADAPPDGGVARAGDTGCGCVAAGGTRRSNAGVFLALALGLRWARRRRGSLFEKASRGCPHPSRGGHS
jgi:MYXO-CTERM domain-containing protein